MFHLYKQTDGFSRIVCRDTNQIELDKEKLVQVDEETYYKLEFHQLMWQNGELVENPNYQEYFNEQQNLAKRKELEHNIVTLKHQLAETDYRALKYFEGYYTEEEYAPYKAERQSLRDEINQLEQELKTLN